MKLIKQLTIGGVQFPIIADHTWLDLTAPGRAIFTVANAGTLAVNQLVLFDVGYSHQDTLQRFFIGFVEKVTPVGQQRTKLVCRELSAALAHPMPLNLRHVSMRDVLTAINEKTCLDFATPGEPYATKKVANFFNLGTGYQAMMMIGRVFNVPDYIWQQQGRGVVYAGSWKHSRWAKTQNVTLPQAMFDKESGGNSARLAAVPALRPGVRVNGHRITDIELNQNHMVLTWNS